MCVFMHTCFSCQNKYQLRRVVTTSQKTDNEIIQYAHIFYDTPQRTYHIRLHIFDNYTNIAIIKPDGYYSDNSALRLPGYPLTPANVKNKLPIYMLFS
jgi:hypothetical protein